MAVVVSVLFAFSVAGLTFAAEQKAAEKKAPAKVNQISGEVVAVDAKAKTLTVKGAKGDVALSLEEKSSVKLADIKTGDRVVVKYKEMDGKNVAISVAKKAAEKKEAAPAAPKAEEKKPAAPAEKKKTGGY